MNALPARRTHDTPATRPSSSRLRSRWPYRGSAPIRAERPADVAALERAGRRLRGLERHLAELGKKGEAYAASNIAGELESAIERLAGPRIGSIA